MLKPRDNHFDRHIRNVKKAGPLCICSVSPRRASSSLGGPPPPRPCPAFGYLPQKGGDWRSIGPMHYLRLKGLQATLVHGPWTSLSTVAPLGLTTEGK